MKKVSIVLIIVMLISTVVYADSGVVVTLGKDLNLEQREQLLEVFGVEPEGVVILEVNNEEEREYLEGIVPDGKLGTRTISSASVELLEEGSGIVVETYNINWVTPEMFTSALVTAGVKDAKVIAAAPFPVSGTGALTGVVKAFEEATGQMISEENKKVANEEVYQTGELGEAIGQDEASELVRRVKEEVVTKKLKSPEEITQVIINIAAELNIELTDKQIESITALMEKISSLNIDTEQIKNQLKNIGKKIDQVAKNEDVQNLFQQIWSAIKEFFVAVFSKK